MNKKNREFDPTALRQGLNDRERVIYAQTIFGAIDAMIIGRLEKDAENRAKRNTPAENPWKHLDKLAKEKRAEQDKPVAENQFETYPVLPAAPKGPSPDVAGTADNGRTQPMEKAIVEKGVASADQVQLVLESVPKSFEYLKASLISFMQNNYHPSDFRRVLRVGLNATQAQIKEAYEKLTTQLDTALLSPSGEDAEAQQELIDEAQHAVQLIKAAYEALTQAEAKTIEDEAKTEPVPEVTTPPTNNGSVKPVTPVMFLEKATRGV